MSVTSLKVSSMVGASCGGESASEEDYTYWSSIGIVPLKYVESDDQILEMILHVRIYLSDQDATEQHCHLWKIQEILHL